MQNLRQTVSVETKVIEKEDQIIKVLMKIVKSVTAPRDREIPIEIREGTRETHKIKKKDALITKTDPREETKRGIPPTLKIGNLEGEKTKIIPIVKETTPEMNRN
jgi:hypothetical protein